MPRTVVSLTTLPGRYEKLRRMLSSLAQQTLRPDAVYLGIPLRSKRLKVDYGELPRDILDQVTLVRLKEDYGPVCKLIGALERETDAETLIVTLDDDVMYPADHLERMVRHAREHPQAAVAASGLILAKSGLQVFGAYHSVCRNRLFSFAIGKEGREIDVVYGFSGVCYRRGFFGEDVEDCLLGLGRDNSALFMNDDVLLSGYLSARGVKRMVFADFAPIGYTGLDAEETDISYHRLRMIARMQRAVLLCRKKGMFKSTSRLEPSENLNSKILLIAMLVIVTLLLAAAALLV